MSFVDNFTPVCLFHIIYPVPVSPWIGTHKYDSTRYLYSSMSTSLDHTEFTGTGYLVLDWGKKDTKRRGLFASPWWSWVTWNSGWQWFCSKATQEDGLLGRDFQTCLQQDNVGTQSDFSHGSCRVYSVCAWLLDVMAGLLWTNWFGQSNLLGTGQSYKTWAAWFVL